MNAWHILDIEPTSDQRAIKRAYAKKLKLIDQENDPQGFLNLREAFESAKYQAQWLDEEEAEEDVWADSIDIKDQDLSTQQRPNEQQGLSPLPPPHPTEYQTEIHLESHPKALNDTDQAVSIFSQTIEDHQDAQDQASPYIAYDIYQHNTSENSDPHVDFIEYQLQELYTSLEDNISRKDIFFSLKNALRQIQQKLRQLPKAQQDFHRQQFILLLAQYDLDNFSALLQSEDASIETEHITSSTQTDQINQDPQDVQALHFSPSQTAHAHLDINEDLYPDFSSSSDLFIQHQRIITALQSHDFSTEAYVDFYELLQNLTKCSLNEQLEITESLRDTLAYLEVTEYTPNFGKFIRLWYQHYPEDEDCLQHSYADDRLREYADTYLRLDHLYQTLTPQYRKTFEQIQNDEAVSIFEVFGLHTHFAKTMKIEQPIEFLSSFSLKNISTNRGFILFSLIHRHWASLWWVITNLGIVCFINLFFDISVLSSILIFLGLIPVNILLQNFLVAQFLACPQQEQRLLRLSQFWFISGILLCATPLIIPTLLHQILSVIWFLISMLLFNCLGYLYPDAIKMLALPAQKIKADLWVITLGLLCIALILLQYFSTDYDKDTLWVACFALIPLGFLIFNPVLHPLYQSFGYRLDEPSEDYTDDEIRGHRFKQFFANFLFLIFRIGLIAWGISYLNLSQQSIYFVYVALFCFASLIILPFHIKIISYLLKYMSYFIIFIVSLNMNFILPLITGILFLITLIQDFRGHPLSTST